MTMCLWCTSQTLSCINDSVSVVQQPIPVVRCSVAMGGRNHLENKLVLQTADFADAL